MKYHLHPNLGSFFNLAIALFREIAEGGPSFGGLLRDVRLSQVIEVADAFGKLALHEVTTAEEYIRMNKELTDEARAADEKFKRGGDSFYSDDKSTFADSHPGFEATSFVLTLDEQPNLFNPQPDRVTARLRGESEAKYNKMVEAAYAIMPDSETKDAGRFVLGLCLLVAATVVRAYDWALPAAIPYPERRQDVVLPHRSFRVGAGYLMGVQELQYRVHSMARACIVRIEREAA
jgi:hypothetical protein